MEGRHLVEQEFNEYYLALTGGNHAYRREVPLAPPAGFAAQPEGLAVALAELRHPEDGERYRQWIDRSKDSLSFEQKSLLASLERQELMLDARQERAVERRDAIAKQRADVLSTIAEAMPALPSTGDLGIARSQTLEAQRRSAAAELSELPRTVSNGLGYMWNPNFQELLNAEIWMEAAGQIFFSISVGFGIIINYSSYLRRKDDVVLSGLTATATNEFCEVCLGGMIAIPATFLFLGTATTLEVINRQSSFGLGFSTLPTVFADMPGGRWIAVAWFGLLFLAGITSSIAMLQPAVAFAEEGLGMKRRGSVLSLAGVTLLGSLPVVYFSENMLVLDTMDYWVGTCLIYVLAMGQLFLFSWVLGVDKGIEAAHVGAKMRIPRFFRFIIKYVTPTYLILVFGAWLVQNAPTRLRMAREDNVVLMTIVGIVAFSIFVLILIRIAAARWQAEGRIPHEEN